MNIGPALVTILIMLCGIGGIICSILADRNKSKNFFIAGIVFTSIVTIYIAYYWEYFWLVLLVTPLWAGIHLAFIIIPIIFLIKSQKVLDPNRVDNEVTDAFLDEIIHDKTPVKNASDISPEEFTDNDIQDIDQPKMEEESSWEDDYEDEIDKL